MACDGNASKAAHAMGLKSKTSIDQAVRAVHARMIAAAPDRSDEIAAWKETGVLKIDPRKIKLRPESDYFYRNFDTARMQQAQSELEQSIRINGVLQPLVLSIIDGQYWLDDGMRRLTAVKTLIESGHNVETVPYRIAADDLTTVQRLLHAEIYNSGEQFSREERGRLFLCIRDQHNYDIQQIAEATGRHPQMVLEDIAIAQLPPHLLEQCRQGVLSETYAFQLFQQHQERAPQVVETVKRSKAAGGSDKNIRVTKKDVAAAVEAGLVEMPRPADKANKRAKKKVDSDSTPASVQAEAERQMAEQEAAERATQKGVDHAAKCALQIDNAMEAISKALEDARRAGLPQIVTTHLEAAGLRLGSAKNKLRQVSRSSSNGAAKAASPKPKDGGPSPVIDETTAIQNAVVTKLKSKAKTRV